MTIDLETTIAKDVEAVWQVLGKEFAHADAWASVINHSKGSGAGLHGATCSERVCDTSMGGLGEKLVEYSDQKHTLSYQVYRGMPFMIKEATNTWTAIPATPQTTVVKLSMKLQYKGILGTLARPLMNMMMKKMMTETLDELKYYVEYGTPHPRKVKAIAAFAKRKAA